MTNFQALDTLTTYSNISKIRLWIQISLCGNARIQMDISKKNGFLSRESNKLFSLAPRKEIRYQHVKCLSPSSFSPLPGFQFSHGNWRQKHTEAALRFLHQLNWSCMINAKWLPDILSQRALSSLIWVFFLRGTLPKRLKFNQVDIFIFKVKKKSTITRYEICPKFTIKVPKRR